MVWGVVVLGALFLGYAAGLAIDQGDWRLSVVYAGISAALVVTPVLEYGSQSLFVYFGVLFLLVGYLTEDLFFNDGRPVKANW